MASQQLTVEDFAGLIADHVSSKIATNSDEKLSSLLLREVKEVRSLIEKYTTKKEKAPSVTENAPRVLERIQKAFGNILPKTVASGVTSTQVPKSFLESAKDKVQNVKDKVQIVKENLKEKTSETTEKIQKIFTNIFPKNFVAKIANKDQGLAADKPETTAPKSLLESTKTVQQVEIKNFKDLGFVLTPIFKDAFEDINKHLKEMSKDIKSILKQINNIKGGKEDSSLISDVLDMFDSEGKTRTRGQKPGKFKQWIKKTKIGQLARRANVALKRTLPRAFRSAAGKIGTKATEALSKIKGSSVGRAVGSVGEKATEALSKIKGSSVGRAVGSVGEKAGKVLGKISTPKVGGALAVLAAGADFAGRKAEGQTTTQAVVGTAGGVAGGLAGAAIGQALIPIPVVGALIGGAVGSWLGGKAADKLTGVGKQKEKAMSLDEAVKEYPQLESLVKRLESAPKDDLQSAEKLKMIKMLKPAQIGFLVAGQKAYKDQPALQNQILNKHLNHLYTTEYVKMIGADHLEGGLPVDKEGKPLNKEHEKQVKAAQGVGAIENKSTETKAPSITPEPVKEALTKAPSITPEPVKEALKVETKAPSITPEPVKEALKTETKTPVIAPEPVKKAGTSVFKGAAVGAVTGAALGSIIPVVGTTVGAAVGGIVGGIGGKLFGNKKPESKAPVITPEPVKEALKAETKAPITPESNKELSDKPLNSKIAAWSKTEPEEYEKFKKLTPEHQQQIQRAGATMTQNTANSIFKKTTQYWYEKEGLSSKAENVEPKSNSNGGIKLPDVKSSSNSPSIAPAPSSVPVIKTSDNVKAPKDDKNLQEIASNTNNTNETLANLVTGFNNMAKALREFGVNVANQPPTVINNTSGSNSRPQKIPSSVNANAGNSSISDFRIGFVEAARMRPA